MPHKKVLGPASGFLFDCVVRIRQFLSTYESGMNEIPRYDATWRFILNKSIDTI